MGEIRTKPKETFTLVVRRGVLVFQKGRPETADGRMRLNRETLLELAVGGISWSEALAKGRVTVVEGRDAVDRFAPLIEQDVVVARKTSSETEKRNNETAKPLKGTVHTHETPAFSIVYPESWSAGEPDPGCIFTAKGGMFGIPKMNVLKEKAFVSPEDAAKDTIRIVEQGKGAKNCKIVYARKTTLADGTPAFEIMIVWDHPMMPGLYTAKTFAQKGDVIIGVSITDNKEISAPTLQFLRSLKIK